MELDLSNRYIFEGGFGLERETMRVDENGEMARTPHPFSHCSLLDRDFCENQLELITPVCGSIDELFAELTRLDNIAKTELKEHGEYLWLYSNPPRFESESDIPVARFGADKEVKNEYRAHLEKRYGKRIMLYSGIHFNFSFSDELIKSLCEYEDFGEFKNALYFRLLKQAFRYSWLPLLLTAASPVYDLSLDGHEGGDGFDGFASRRSGIKGYWNKFIPVLDYSSITAYIDSVRGYIRSGKLFSEWELYLPVRLKPRGANTLASLCENGIDHIELRMFDVNPLSPVGMFKEDAQFAHYFLVYLTSLPDFEFTPKLQIQAIKNHRAAARYLLSDIKINGYDAKSAALGMLSDMEIFYKSVPAARKNIAYQAEKIRNDRRYCTEIYEKFHENYQNKMFEEIDKLR